MAFKPISDLFENEKSVWQEGDVKHFVQEYLRRETGSDAVYCQSIGSGAVTIRVGTPALYQAVYIMKHDLALELVGIADYKLKSLKVIS